MENEKAQSTTKQGWLWIIPAAVVVMILNVAVHVLYMVVYSYLIHPGDSVEHYQAHATFSAPYSSILFGMPLMFLGARWVARKFTFERAVLAAVLVWAVYFTIDATVLLSVGELRRLALIFSISFATKLVAAYLGGFSARKRMAQTPGG